MAKYLLVSMESFQRTGDVPDSIKKFLDKYPAPLIGLDESSKIKANSACKYEALSKRTQGILKLNETGERCIMTGTFMSVSPVNAYTQAKFLNKDYFPEGIFAFQNRHCVMYKVPNSRGVRAVVTEEIWAKVHKRLNREAVKGQEALRDAMDATSNYWSITDRDQFWIMEHEEYTPFKNIDRIYAELGEAAMIVRKEDVLDMPPKVYVKRLLEPTDEMARLYRALYNTGFTDEVVAADTMSLYHRYKDLCNGYIPYADEFDKDGKQIIKLRKQKSNVKLDALLSDLEEVDLLRTQGIVLSDRTDFLHDAAKELEARGYRVAIYDGTVKEVERERIEKDFKARRIDLLCLNQMSGAFGLDWVQEADYEFYLSNDFSPERRSQAEDRVHRGSQKRQKFIYDYCIRGTIDERVKRALDQGIDLIRTAKTSKKIRELLMPTF